jgi:ribonuclease BN (tRNA processing enzyme)
MKLTVLGSGGWIPTSSRQTSCYLITSGTETLVLDAGTGLGTLHINPAMLEGVET